MRFLRTAKVKIDALKLPGDWKRRLADPDVHVLASSFDAVPLLQRPGIRKDREIIWGRDRLAALYYRGERKVEVDIWEATDDEVRLAELTENARRRHGNRDAAVRDLVSLLARQQAEAVEDAGTPAIPPPEQRENPLDTIEDSRSSQPVTVTTSKSTKAAARKKAAELLGTTPAAVKQAEHRASVAEGSGGPEAPGEGGAPDEPPAPGATVTAALAEINALLIEAQKKLTRLTQAEPTLGDRFNVQSAKSQISEAASVLRGCAPGGECLYCKLVPSEQPNCQPCAGSGWLTKAQLANVPAELRVTGEGASIYVRGELVRTSVLLKGAPAPASTPAPSKPHRGARRIRVVDDAGNQLPVPPVED